VAGDTASEERSVPKSPYRAYTPNPEQIELMPSISGNTVNGVGEREFRRASPVYWRDPDTLQHGELQKWFYTQNVDNKAIEEARAVREKILEIEVPPPTAEPLQQTAGKWTADLSSYADTLDMELFGIAKFRVEWTFDDANLDHEWVIMIGVAHDYDELKKAPELTAGAEVIRQYGRGIKAAKDIATWIRERGWNAEPYGGPMSGPLLMIPPAIECGFGELGKHGSVINRDYGSAFRLAAVLTDVPLIPTPHVSYNVDDFCSRCQVCSNACPPDAIMPEKTLVRGESKWYVDFDKCIPFFNENFGCGICIVVCPWSIPGRGPRIVQQLLRRAARRNG
jgi:ferredoxin